MSDILGLPPRHRADFSWVTGEHLVILLLTLAALAVRLIGLDAVPPGWRDDELINSLVISQKVLDGDLALYYSDASGHEALYHALNALFLGIFGPGVAGIRWLSVLLGTATVPLTYAVGRRLYGRVVGLIAAAALTVSFWSLMYSRIGLRHILLPVLVLLAFYFFWSLLPKALGGEQKDEPAARSGVWDFDVRGVVAAALFVGLGFYTYFAGRGVPLILLAFMAYVLLVAPHIWRRCRRNWLLLLGAMLLLALPLLVTLQRQPEAEGRVAELAVPLVAAGTGDFEPLRHHVVTTLSMFHAAGDDEWLYNIPHRPVFGIVGALFFWLGVFIAAVDAVRPLPHLWRRRQAAGIPLPHRHAFAGAFLLLWWLAGISPGFISVPPASLGHTIMAQPAVYLLAALPVWRLGQIPWPDYRVEWRQIAVNMSTLLMAMAGLALLVGVGWRDVPDYFDGWARRGMVRFLYRGDIHQVADYLNETPDLTDFGMTGLLAGPWDKVALAVDIDRPAAVGARWFNPERAVLLQPPLSFTGWPNVSETYADWYTPWDVALGEYQLQQVTHSLDVNQEQCFQNGLCLVSADYDPQTHYLELGWRVAANLVLPAKVLISNPPPPGVYSGPRLYAFGQLWDADDHFLAGDDGLWVDPYTLQQGDIFLQQHRPQVPAEVVPHTAVFGLYDPMTGARVLTLAGQDHVRLDLEDSGR